MSRVDQIESNTQKRTTSMPPKRGHRTGFAGPNGYCTCPNCGYTESHQRGKPCNTKKCPKCNTFLMRVTPE